MSPFLLQHGSHLSVITISSFLLCLCLVTQSCPTLCDPIDYSPPGSHTHGISQTRYRSGLTFPSPGIFLIQGSNLHLLCCRQILYPLCRQGSPSGDSDNEPACQRTTYKKHGFIPWVWKIWSKAQQPTPVFLFGEYHGKGRLASYSPKVHRVGHNWSSLVGIGG